MSLLRYLDPETFLHLKETFPKCIPEYPYIEKLPGLTFAYKTNNKLLTNHEHPDGFPRYRVPRQSHRLRNRSTVIPPSQYRGVFILSIDNHHPYSYETIDGEEFYQYNITHETRMREPFAFPFVKPGDVFLKVETWSSKAFGKLAIPIESIIPILSFITDTARFKYHYIDNKRDFAEVKESYVNLEKRFDAIGALFSLWTDIVDGFINWTYPFDIMILYQTMVEEEFDDKAGALSMGVYTTQEVREFCVLMGLPTVDTDTAVGMCKSLFASVGFTI